MNIKFILKEECDINEEVYCKIVIVKDKKMVESIKESYSNKIIEVEQSGKKEICLLSESIPDDKKVIKFTTECISETLFDVGWYFKNNDIDDSNFEVVIISEDEKTKELYIKACERMGLL